MKAAFDSLRGVALGDCFGETFFFRPWERTVPEGPWRWTDDTAMALSVYRMLVMRGEVVQDELAGLFAKEYEADPHRNYGASMHDVLQAIAAGEPWPEVTRRQFDGRGSWGNGAAMRVAPLGAWFAKDLDEAVLQAGLSAAVTHAHAEAAAGAVAVAVATALAVQGIAAHELIKATLAKVPRSEVAVGLRLVLRYAFSSDPLHWPKRWGAAGSSRRRTPCRMRSGARQGIWTICPRRCGRRRRPGATSTPPVRWWAGS